MTQGGDTQTALLVEVRAGLDGMKTSVQKLERTVQGDVDAGTPSLRQAIRSVADEMNIKTETLGNRIDELESANNTQQAYLRGITTVVKWLGGGTLAGLLAVIGLLSGVFGGGK